MNSVIRIKNLSVYYGDNCALSDINLDIHENDFLGIIGPNGSGKSTLLKTILGLVKPSKGSVEICAGEVKRGPLIGYVPQYTGFEREFPISVWDAILTGRLPGKLKLYQKFGPEDFEIAHSLMEKLDISHLKHRQIGRLSGGQLQRVLLARALAVEPKILLLDEPTASVDSDSKTKIYDFLKEINSNMTIVVVTHDVELVSSYMTDIACLNKTLHYHGKIGPGITQNLHTYSCPVEIIAQSLHQRDSAAKEGEHNA